MKHLISFNESLTYNLSDLYTEIDSKEFYHEHGYNKTLPRRYENLLDKDIKLIKDTLTDYNVEVKKIPGEEINTNQIVAKKIYPVDSDFYSRRISIKKIDDDYYYVCTEIEARDHVYDSEHICHVYIPSKNHRMFYKCDTIKGLIYVLENIDQINSIEK